VQSSQQENGFQNAEKNAIIMYQKWRKAQLLESWEIMCQKEEKVQEDPRSDGLTPLLQETGYQPNRNQKQEEEEGLNA
jgi:hypothetical protein